MPEYSFSKSERLKSKLDIQALFESGDSLLVYPLRILWKKSPGSSPLPVKATVSVSKRNFKKAVSRNLLKRRMREAYRLNKTLLTETCRQSDILLNVMIIYIGKEEAQYAAIEKSMLNLLDKVRRKVLITDS